MSQIGLIPHAGESYSGLCRKRVFQKMISKPKYIIYIANDHHNRCQNPMGIINSTPTHSWMSNISVESDEDEHSYTWVIPEIEDYFNMDRGLIKSYMLGKSWDSQNKEILELVRDCLKKNGIVLVSADLTHFGKSYKFQGLEKPEVYSKYQFEEELIFNLVSSNYQGVSQELNQNPDLSCSVNNLNFLSFLTQKEKKKGRVVDYYDSNANSKKGYQKYLIPLEKVNKLVSYVGIVYFSNYKKNKLFQFDKNLAFAFIHSSLEHQFKYTFLLPKWSIWYQMKNGIFIATELKDQNKKTCCVGEYESEGKTSADFINNLAQSCQRDGSRWDFNFSQSNLDFNDFIYEIEVLQPENKWKEMPATDLDIDKNSPYGIYLTLRNGRATYLPYVWRDSISGAKNVKDVLDSLTSKALGTGYKDRSWRNDNQATVRLYKSKKYNSKKKKNKKNKKKTKRKKREKSRKR